MNKRDSTFDQSNQTEGYQDDGHGSDAQEEDRSTPEVVNVEKTVKGFIT